jgi:hypothetical protein
MKTSAAARRHRCDQGRISGTFPASARSTRSSPGCAATERHVEVIGYNQASADIIDRFALHDKTGVELGVVPH